MTFLKERTQLEYSRRPDFSSWSEKKLVHVGSMHHIAPWGAVEDMDLPSFAAWQPVLNAVIGLKPEILWHFLAFLNLLYRYTHFLCMADLFPIS